MARIPIIEDATGKVVNVIELKAGVDWAPHEGHSLGPEGGEKHDTWNGSSYDTPPPPPPDPIEEARRQAAQDEALIMRAAQRDAMLAKATMLAADVSADPDEKAAAQRILDREAAQPVKVR